MKTRLSRTLRSTARLSLPLTFAIVALLSSHSAIAGNTWDGTGGTGFWNTPANWNGDTLPTNSAALIFAGNVQNITTNNLAADSSFLGINFNNTGATGSSNAFTLAGNRIILGGNIVTANNTTGTTITPIISLDMILNGNRTITTGQQNASVQHNLTISGAISSSGAFGLTKDGGGTLILSGANTYTGTTTVSAGTLTLSGNRTVNTTGDYTVSGAGTQTLNIQAGNYGIGGSFIVGNSGGTATVNHSAGTISSVGANGLLLGNGSTAGTRAIYNLSGGSLTSANITMGVNSGASAANPITALIDVSGGTLTATTLRIGRYDSAGVFNTFSTFTQTAGTTTVSTLGLGGNSGNALNSTGPIIANLNLTGGTFTATTIASLSAGGAASASDANSSSINIGGNAQVTLGTFGSIVKGQNSTATITFDSGATGFLAPVAASATYMPTGTFTRAFLTANGANFNVGTLKDITIGQVLENASGAAGTLTKSGVGVLTLSGNNTYTGATTLSAGTLSVGTIGNGGVAGNLGAASADASNLVFAGGGLSYTGATASSDRSFTMLNGAVNSINVSNALSTLTLTGSSPTNTGLLRKDGAGGLTLNPVEGNGYSVGSINANGGTLTLKSGTFTTTGIDSTTNITGYNISAGARNGGTLTVDGAALTVDTGGNRRFVIGGASSGTGNLRSGSITADTVVIGHNGSATMTQSGGTLTTGDLYHQDSGNGTYTMTGGTLTARSIRYVAGASITNSSGNSFTFRMDGGTVKAAAGVGTTDLFADTTGGGTLQMAVQLGTNGATIDTSLSSARIVRPLDNISGQAGTLTKIGANTLTLSGTNTYTGVTTVSSGTLAYGVSNALSTGAVTVNGGTLALSNFSDSVGTVTLTSGNITGGTGVLSSTGTFEMQSGSVSAILAGTGALTKSGAGMVSLTAANTYSGGTTVSAGTLQLGNGGGVSGNIANNATFLINRTDSSTLENVISGSGAVTQSGTGTTVLSGENTYTGTTTVSAGTLTLSGNRTVNTTGGYTVFGTGAGTQTLNIQGGNYGIGGSFFVGNSGGTATVNHSAGTISGVGVNGLVLGNGSFAGTTAIYNLSGGSLTAANITMGANSGASAANRNTSEFNVSGGTLAATTLRIGNYTSAGVYNTMNTFTQTAGTTTVSTLGLGGNSANAANSTGPQIANLNLTGGTFTATNIASISAGGAASDLTANSSFINIGGNAQVTLGAFPTARGSNSTATITFDSGATGFLAPVAASATYMPTGTFTSASLTTNGANFNVGTLKDITIGQVLENASGAAGTLTKSGAGVLTLSGTNTYTGATTVSAGTLLVDTGASVAASTSIVNGGLLRVNGIAGSVTVNSGGSLGGSGTVGAVTLTSGSLLNPGNSPGLLTAASSSWVAGSTYQWEIINATGTAGDGWDLFSVTGALDMSALSSSSKMNLVLESLSLANYSTTTPFSWTIAKAGSFTGDGFADGTNVTDLFSITAAAFNDGNLPTNGFKVEVWTDANNLRTLNLMAIPEPSTGALLGFGLGGLVVTRLLRRKQS